MSSLSIRRDIRKETMRELNKGEKTFCKVTHEILAKYKFDVDSCFQCQNQCTSGLFSSFDIYAKKDGIKYLVEIKSSRSNRISADTLMETAKRMILWAKDNLHNCKYKLLLFIFATVSPQQRESIEKCGVTVVDIRNLLFLVRGDERLKLKLISELDFSIDDLVPEEPDRDVFGDDEEFSFEQESEFAENEGEDLKSCLLNWKIDSSVSRSNSGNYEKLCINTLKYLFSDDLALWEKQADSNDGLYRFDLICKIKDGNVGGFWGTIRHYFNSKYIIFEFKNYSEEITQKEIYTTDKYLYLKALRCVAIIISCKGSSKNADKAIRGTLRENGKLILSLNNEDLIEMINMKINLQSPSDFLDIKLDNLLVELEK